MNSFFRKLRWLMRRYGKEAELREELQFHLEQEAEERHERGLAEHEARWAARRELGNLALVTEDTRAAWGWTRLEQLARDSGYGLRQVRRNPAFSTIATATLALGIGGITAMFSAADAVLVRPLPYADADRLVMVWDDLSKIGDRSRGLALTLAGLVIGLILAAVASRLMTNLLYGFQPDYISTVTVVSFILLAVAALACLVPARRASRIDPIIALHHE
jgi:hypothetical protein